MEQSQNVILSDSMAYSNIASNNDSIVLRLNNACNTMSDLPKGKMLICYIIRLY